LGADGRRTYHPSYGRHVSVSRLVNVENQLRPLTLSLPLFLAPIHFPVPLSLFLIPPSSSLTVDGRGRCAASAPFIGLCLLSFPRPPRRRYFGPRKLFGRARRLLISWPRLSSSGLVLTRCYSSRRIHRIRNRGRCPEHFFAKAGNLCDRPCMRDKSQCS